MDLTVDDALYLEQLARPISEHQSSAVALVDFVTAEAPRFNILPHPLIF